MTIRSSFARAALVAGIAIVPFALDAFTLSSLAQNTAPATKPAAKTPYETTIAVESTLVRAAPSVESGYPFGSLRQGATVKVVEEQVGWVAVQTSGSAFDGWFGFVQAGPGIALSADGKSIKVSSRAQISAPNAEANWNPDSSWKAIGFLVAGDEMPVLGEVKGQRDTFYKVALNTKTVGWINASAITPATGATAPATTAPTTTDAPSVPNTTTTNEPPVQVGEKVEADSNPVDPDPTQDTATTETKLAPKATPANQTAGKT
ncbi:MAG: SH3-like domain-containing protein, partial [bacterium]